MTTLTVTINGRAYGPMDVRDDLTMNDFLREYLGMTGTKFGCGAAQCLSCAVIVDNPDGTSHTSPTCVVPAASFDGKAIRTVEGHAKNGELSALQKAFIEHFAFQCGYCTAGFLNEGQVLLERLAKKPVARADLEKTIAEALDGHLCRCTGYIKYHEAVRDVILADPGRYLLRMPIDARPTDRDRSARRCEMKSEMRIKFSWRSRRLLMSMLTARRRCHEPSDSLASAGKLCLDRRHGGAVGGIVHRARQGADPSALHELPSGRRPPAPGRSAPAASAAGRARRGRSWPPGHALPDLSPEAPISSPAACRAIRTGISRRAKWRGKARRSARSARRSRIPRATATARWKTSSIISAPTRWSAGPGRRAAPHARSRHAKGSRRARRGMGANRRGVPALDRG